jgi:hypothetical protein
MLNNIQHSNKEWWTQPGTEINFPANNMAVVPFQNPAPPPSDLGADYTAEFTRIFTIIEGWCREYTHTNEIPVELNMLNNI